jgi:hypothetical protein
MGTKNIFITRVNKKGKVEINSAAPNVSKWKYTQHVSYHCPPLYAAL